MLSTLIISTVLVAVIGSHTPGMQSDHSAPIRLFRMDGTFSDELPLKIESEHKTFTTEFALKSARLEADSLGALNKLRSIVVIANAGAKRITKVEWQLDIHDASLRNLSTRVVQSDTLNIYPGETGTASARLGAVLPDRIVVLLQLLRVSFEDGSAWSPPDACYLKEDLRTAWCKSK